VAESTRLTARALLYYSIGLPAWRREADCPGVLLHGGTRKTPCHYRFDFAGHQHSPQHLFFIILSNKAGAERRAPRLATPLPRFLISSHAVHQFSESHAPWDDGDLAFVFKDLSVPASWE